MRKGTIALFVVIAFICSATFALAAKAPDTVTMKGATKGTVTFSHKGHIDTAKIACKECHHKGGNQKCDMCHKADCKPGGTPCMKEAAHKKCIGCHKTKNQGPKGCNDCHKK